MKYNYDDGASAGEARYVRLSSVEYPDGRNVFYIYPSSGIGDALGRVEAIAGDAAGATRFAEYAYLGAGTIVSVAHPAVTNGLTLDYNPNGNYEGWDRFGRVIDQRWTDGAGTADLDRYTYTYDGNSNRTSRSNALNGTFSETYSYDGLNRLVDTNRNGTDLQSWNLDSLGNWSSFTNEGTTEERTFNAANEIQNISSPAVPPEDAVSPEFDAAGNMISGPRPDDPLVRQHYIYDAWNRLVEVRADNPDNSGSPGDAIATFEYDGRNFRIGKTVGGVLEAFYYNEGQQLLETQVDGAATEEYVWDNRYIDAPILRATPGEVLYYANDANMNITALVDAATGLVVERYHYDPYGEVQFMEADWTPRAASAFDNAVLYTGRRLDAETGLFYYRARYYDATLGRFINRDPIGYEDGPNLYQYVNGNPSKSVDPLGLRGNATGITHITGRGKWVNAWLKHKGSNKHITGMDWPYVGSDMFVSWSFDQAAFSKDGCCSCTEIGFIQITKHKYISGWPINQDWHIDKGIPYPHPIGRSVINPCNKDIPRTAIDFNDNPGYAHPILGRFTLTLQKQFFEVGVVCLKGPEKGALYDSIRWGHLMNWGGGDYSTRRWINGNIQEGVFDGTPKPEVTINAPLSRGPSNTFRTVVSAAGWPG